jgi:glyoxylase-like metal-dependent hydrolase (beta-lactamase superfamily II)
MKAFVYRWASALVVGYAVFIGSVGADSIIGQSSKPLDLPEFCQNLPRPEYASLNRIDYPNHWFELYDVADGVTAIYEPFQWQEAISYLIEGSESALLFDTGNGIEDIAAVVATLTDKPITVLNSHGHYDHVGGNFAYSDILGMNTDFTRSKQAGQPNSNIRIEVSPEALCLPPPSGVTQETHVGKGYAISTFIEDGHVINLGDRSLEVMLIPGHTPDAIALFDKDAGLLWTGDSFYAGPIWLYSPETDLEQYRVALQRLMSVKGVKWLLPAHNTPLVKPKILPEVLVAFDDMLAGKLKKTTAWEGTVIYSPLNQTSFSFLMRDEALPYSSD